MITTAKFPATRLRRLRSNETIRDLIRETRLSVDDLVYPLFITHGENKKLPVATMPGCFQLSVDQLPQEIDSIKQLGLKAILLFGIPEQKDAMGSDSFHDHGIIQKALRVIKAQAPNLLVITDLCFCEYTDHGHCGVIKDHNGVKDVDNDATLELLAKQAVSHVAAGADIVAPSGMVDGMVGAIRQGLDQKGYTHIPILSYSNKYCSALYGPFRAATEGAPQFGDRRGYQIDPANARESLRDAALDLNEGADMLMVKPATLYLDVLSQLKERFPGVPICAYHVGGEYAMIKAASEKGWIDERKVCLESMLSIKRAGADFIFTYYAKDIAAWL